MPRVLWKGAISVGLVHIPVSLYPATQSERLSFDMIDKRDFSPIGYRKINKRTGEENVYFTMQRRQRLFSSRQQQTGARTNYIGTEVFVSVVDGRERSGGSGFRQLDVEALCTNRDLPIHTTFG